MNQTVNGIKYYLADDCDTLVCKLENALDDQYFGDKDLSKIDALEIDLSKLELAIECNNRTIMQYFLNKYSHWFKRYR